jgi:hypothetical protein
MQAPVGNQTHSTGWVVQAWSSFAIAVIAMTIGILNLPVDNWIKGYMGIGLSLPLALHSAWQKPQETCMKRKESPQESRKRE